MESFEENGRKSYFVRRGKMSCGWQPIHVLDGQGDTYINKKGKVMPNRFKAVTNFNEGYAIVQNFDGKLTYVDTKGKVMNLSLDFACSFYQGKGVGYIKTDSYYVLPNGTMYDVLPAYEFFLPTKDEKECIYKTKTGKMFTRSFDIIGKISEGMIPIEMKDGSGKTYFNTMTKRILKTRYSKIGDFKGGFADVITMQGDILCIDTFGEAHALEDVDFLRLIDTIDSLLDDTRSMFGEGEGREINQENYNNDDNEEEI